MTKYICKYCNYESDNQSNFLKHNKTSKHIKLSNKSLPTEKESIVESISVVENKSEINTIDIKHIMDILEKQNEIIEKQNNKIEILENKIELLIQEKTENKHIIEDNQNIWDQID